jgi:hypothetical protein
MPSGYTRTELNRKLVIVPNEIEERAKEETRGNNTRANYFKALKDEEKAKRVSAQSRFFAQHGTRDGEKAVGDEEQDRELTKLKRSKGNFAKATHEMQQAAILEMSRRRDAKDKQEKAEYLAEKSRRLEERDRREEKSKKTQSLLTQAANNVTNWFRKEGGSKSKEILGKIRRVYKVAGSRKEHVKYKGELIPVSDYKKLFKK